MLNNRKQSLALIFGCVLAFEQVGAQQFNSDSWFSKPAGVVTVILTTGQRNSMLMNTFSLFPRWEFTTAAYLYNDDNDPATNDGFSTSLYAKYMIFENAAKTGGFAVKAGTGMEPGFLDGDDRVKDAFQTYWMNAPVTLPLFDNKVSLDMMPGASMTRQYGDNETTSGAFTYSVRVAWYPINPVTSVVGEVYGAEGGTRAIPEYRIGLRWEPNQYAVFAVTLDDEFNGSNGAGFEVGLMIFSPRFFCFAGCDDALFKKKKKTTR